MSPSERISVVTSTYSKARLSELQDLLRSIRMQGCDIETLCVVEGPPELASEVRNMAKRAQVKVEIIHSKDHMSAGSARNLGLRSSRGTIVAFVDDDADFGPAWAQELVSSYSDPRVVGVTGPIIPRYEKLEMNWFPKELQWIVGCSGLVDSDVAKYVFAINGTNASFRREAIIGIGYPEHIGAEFDAKKKLGRSEWHQWGEEGYVSFQVLRKTGGRILYNPRVLVNHKVPNFKVSPAFIIQRSYQVGGTRRMLRRLYHGQTEIYQRSSRMETQFLTVILLSLVLNLSRLPKSPSSSFKRLCATVLSLAFFSLGFLFTRTSD